MPSKVQQFQTANYFPNNKEYNSSRLIKKHNLSSDPLILETISSVLHLLLNQMQQGTDQETIKLMKDCFIKVSIKGCLNSDALIFNLFFF